MGNRKSNEEDPNTKNTGEEFGMKGYGGKHEEKFEKYNISSKAQMTNKIKLKLIQRTHIIDYTPLYSSTQMAAQT